MSNTPSAPEILTRLGYDGADLKKGFAQARQDYVNYKAQAVLIETELKREKVRLVTEFSAENRRQIQQRIDDLRRELASATGAIAGKRGAERVAAQQHAAEVRQEFNDAQKIVANYQTQKEKVEQLGRAQLDAINKARTAQAAAGVFRETGRATGAIPGLSDLVSNLAPGLASIQSRLGGILNSIVLLGGGIKGGTDEIAAGAGAANSKLLLLGGAVAGTAAGVYLLGKSLVNAALDAGKFAQEIDHVSQKLGISTRDLQVFQAIGTTVGLTLNDMVVAQRQFSAALTGSAAIGPNGELVEGSKKATQILKEFGIETRVAGGALRGTKDILIDLSGVFSELPDGPEKARIAIELFGRSGLNLIPFLNLGPRRIKELQASFEELAPDLSLTGKLYDDLEVQQAKWNLAMTALKNNIAENVLPSLIDFIGRLNELANIEIKHGSALQYLFTRKLEFPQDVGAQLKSMGFEKTPTAGAQDLFEKFIKEQSVLEGTSFKSKGIEEAKAELQKRRPNQITFSKEEVAAQAVVIAGLTEVKKKEEDVTSALDGTLKKIREILAAGKDEGKVQSSIFDFAQQMSKAVDDEAAKRAKLLSLSAQYSVAQKDAIESQRRLNEVIASRNLILSNLGFKSVEQAKAIFAQIAAKGPEAAPQILKSAGVAVPADAKGQKSLDAAKGLTEEAARLATRHADDLALIKQINDEVAKQNAELADLDAREAEILSKRTAELNLTQQIAKAGNDLAAARADEALLAERETALRKQRADEAAKGDSGAAIESGKLLLEVEKNRAAAIEKVNTLLDKRASLAKEQVAAPLKAVSGAALVTESKFDSGAISAREATAQFSSQLAVVNNLHDAQLAIVKALDQQDPLYATALELLKAINDEATKLAKSLNDISVSDLTDQLSVIKGQLAGGLISPDQAAAQFRGQQNQIKNDIADQVAALKELAAQGIDPLAPKYQEQLVLLQKMLGVQKDIKDAAAATSKETGSGKLISSLKDFSDIVGKFDSGLNRNLVQMFALIEGFQVVVKQMQDLSSAGTGVGSFLGGLKALLTGKDDSGKPVDIGVRLSGIVSVAGTIGAAVAGGISQISGGHPVLGGAAIGALGFLVDPVVGVITTAIGASLGAVFSTKSPVVGALAGYILGGPVGAILGGFAAATRRRTQEMAMAVAADFSQLMRRIDAEMRGVTGAALTQLDAVSKLTAKQQMLLPPSVGIITPPTLGGQVDILQAGLNQAAAKRAFTVASLENRPGGGMEQLKKILPEMDKQIGALNDQLNQLAQQQKQVLDSFAEKLGFLRLSEGARAAAESVAQITAALKEAANAGASFADQIEYANLSLADLTRTMGRDLRSAEQNAINLLLQQITLEKQRADVITQADADIAAARRADGTDRALTPGQQAALDVQAIRKRRDEQLAAIDEQAAALDAQIGAQAELFGLERDKASLIATQLDLQRQITAELIAQIQSQMDFVKNPPNAPEILPTQAPTTIRGYRFQNGTTSDVAGYNSALAWMEAWLAEVGEEKAKRDTKAWKWLTDLRGAVPYYQKGGVVPQDQLAYVHKGETIIPASVSKIGRLSYAPDSYHLIEAMLRRPPGNSFRIDTAEINISVPSGTNLTPEQMARIVKQGLEQIGAMQQSGF